MIKGNHIRLICVFISILFLGVVEGIQAQQTYTAIADGAWSNPNTWDPAGVPGDRDVVVINVSNREVTLDITTAVEGFFLSSGTLDGDETLTITEEFSWSGGTLGGTSESDDLEIIIPGNAGAILSGGSKRLDATITNEGAIAWNDGNITSSTAGLGFIDNKGEFAINGSNAASFIRFYNDSGGILRKSSGGAARFSAGQFSNDGEVDVREGTLELFGSTIMEDPKDNGTYLAGPGTVLDFGSANRTLTETSTLDVNGELVVRSGTVEFLGTFNTAQYRQTGGTAFLETGTLVDIPQLTMAGGTFDGSDEINLTGDALWESGTFANGGILVPDGTTLTINLTTTSQLNTTLTNDGTINWTSGRITSGTALLGTIFNNSDLIIRTDNDLAFLDIRNSGVITKESGFGVTFFSSGFFQNEASGLVQINSGTLRIGQSQSVSTPAVDRGTYSAVNGTVLHLSSNRTFAPDSEIIADEVRINFGNITFEGLLDIQTLNQSGNTINTVFDRGRSVTIPNLVLDGGTLTPDDALNTSSQFEWVRGNIAGSEDITVLEGGNFIITGTGSRNLNGTVRSRGAANWMDGSINSSFTGGGTLINEGTFEINSANTFQRAIFINEEEVRKSSSGLTTFSINTLENKGTFLLSDGSVRLNTSSSMQTPVDEGSWILENGTTLIVDGAERQLAPSGFILGSGIIEASTSSLIDNRGIHSPGNSTGVLTYNGDFSMDAGSAEVIITLAGTTPGSGHDQLAVSGQADFMGTLTVLMDDGYTPSNGDQFEVITYGRHSGEFDTVDLPSLSGGLQFDLQYNDEKLLLIVIDDSPNQPPVFTNTFDEETITEGDEFSFQFEADDPDGDELIFSLTQGNDVDNASITTGGLFTFNPETGQAGSYDFTVRVSDGDLFDEHDFSVTVVAINQPPVFNSEPITIAQVNQLYQYDVETSDPDGDPVFVSAITLPGWLSFTADDGGTGLLEGTPAASDIGDHEVVLQASDGEEATTQEFTIEVREEPNEPPVFSTTFDEENITEGDEFTFQFEAEDPDGDDLIFSLTQGNDVENASITTDGLFTFNPEAGQAGSYDFTVRVSDGHLFDEHGFVVNVEAINQPPVFESDPLTIVQVNEQYLYNVVATDPDGDSITLTAPTIPGWLSFTDNGDDTGLLEGTPSTNDVGNHDVVLQASDGEEETLQEFTIEVREEPNEPPFFTETFDEETINEGEEFSFQFEAEDPDGDDLMFSLTIGEDVENTSITPDGLFSFNPEFGQTGVYDFMVRVSDGDLFDEHDFTVIVTVTNRPPEIVSSIPDLLLVEGGVAYQADPDTVFTDPDGDVLTYSAESSDENVATVAIDELLTVEPVSPGTAVITVTADDGRGGTVSDQFEVTVEPDEGFDPPVAENLAEVTWMNLSVTIDLSEAVSHPQNRPVSVLGTESPTVQGGTVEILGDLTLRYSPADGITGEESFTYTVRDDLNREASAEITIDVNAILFELTDLGDLGGGASLAQALNDQGEVTGISLNSSDEIRAFIWSDGELTEPQITGADDVQAYAINNSGTIAGYAGLTETEGNAFRLAGEEAVFSEAVNGSYSAAYAINSVGVIAGVMESGSQYRGFAWNEEFITLNLPEGVLSIVYALSDQNEAAGLVLNESGITRAFRNNELGPEGSRVYSMNSAGMAVGSSNNQPMIWPAGGEAELLDGTGEIYSVNASGWKTGVVMNEMAKSASGYSHFGIRFYDQNPHLSLRRSAARSISGNSRSAALWVGSMLFNLNSLVQDADGWELIEAGAVNESGLIAGTARVNGQLRAFLLTPVENDGVPDELTESFEFPGEESIYLHQNYPNPFNPATTIQFELAEAGWVTLSVYDLLGRRVARLVEGTIENGTHLVQFDASALSSGVYFYRLHTGYGVRVRKLTLLK